MFINMTHCSYHIIIILIYCLTFKELRREIEELSQMTQVVQLLEQLQEMEKLFNRAAIYIPAYDQKSYMQVMVHR